MGRVAEPVVPGTGCPTPCPKIIASNRSTLQDQIIHLCKYGAVKAIPVIRGGPWIISIVDRFPIACQPKLLQHEWFMENGHVENVSTQIGKRVLFCLLVRRWATRIVPAPILRPDMYRCIIYVRAVMCPLEILGFTRRRAFGPSCHQMIRIQRLDIGGGFIDPGIGVP